MNLRLSLVMTLCGGVFAVSCAGDATISEMDGPPADEKGTASRAISCSPQMNHFPVGAAHNIGYDAASCGSGTCETSCPDQNANSDYGGVHHGVDVFAFHRAPIVAVVSGTVQRVGWPSSTSGLRLTISDGCGWWYYYGHLDEAVVGEGQWVEAGQLVGYMGNSGAPSTHLHFNVSADGDYYNDIDPTDLLRATSPTACGGVAGGGGGAGSDGCTDQQRAGCGNYGCGCVAGQCNGVFCPGIGCTFGEAVGCAQYGSNCVDHQCNGGTAPGTGCTARETLDCSQYGSNCVDHQCNGGSAPGTGCTWRESHDCGAYGSNCVDHQCNGGTSPGTGCTWRETHDCAQYGSNCVDHQCNGGTSPGTGCTWRETHDCGQFGANCVDHQCNGGTAPGSGCTWRETHDCSARGAGCVDHACSGGTSPGTGCTFRQTLDCRNQGRGCAMGRCT